MAFALPCVCAVAVALALAVLVAFALVLALAVLVAFALVLALAVLVAFALVVAVVLALVVAVILALAVAVASALDSEELFETTKDRRPIPPSTTTSTSAVIRKIIHVDIRRLGVGGVGVGVTSLTLIPSGGVGGAARYTGGGTTGSGTGCVACAKAWAKAEIVEYLSPGFLAIARPTTTSIARGSVELIVLGGIGQLW